TPGVPPRGGPPRHAGPRSRRGRGRGRGLTRPVLLMLHNVTFLRRLTVRTSSSSQTARKAEGSFSADRRDRSAGRSGEWQMVNEEKLHQFIGQMLGDLGG